MPEMLTILSLKKFAFLCGYYLAAFFLPINQYIIAMFLLVVIDWLTGISAAIHLKEKVTHEGLYRTVVKLRDYLILIIASHLVTIYFFSSLKVPFETLAASYIGLVEFKSIIKNIETTSGLDIWSQINKFIPDAKFRKKTDKKPPEGGAGSTGEKQ